MMYLKYFVKSRLKIREQEKKKLFQQLFLLTYSSGRIIFVMLRILQNARSDSVLFSFVFSFLLTFENLSRREKKKGRRRRKTLDCALLSEPFFLQLSFSLYLSRYRSTCPVGFDSRYANFPIYQHRLQVRSIT